MRKKIKITAACQDPGGCNAILPVVKKMADVGDKVYLYATSHSCRILKKKGVDFCRIPVGKFGSVHKILKRQRPDLVLLGTSSGYSLEDAFVEASRSEGIKTVALFDSWVNYSSRFREPLSGELKYLPDYICVSDLFVKQAMEEEGVPCERIIVTGNPYFDGLSKETKAYYASQARKRLLDKQGMPYDTVIVTFFSQAIDKTFGSGVDNKNFLGYTQFDALELLIRCLKGYCKGGKVLLVIRPHPKESRSVYLRFKKRSKNLAVTICSGVDTRKIMVASDFVAGMFSSILVEAYILGKRILSIQLGLRKRNHFILSKLGKVPALTNVAQIIKALKAREHKRQVDPLFETGNGCRNVMRLIRNLSAAEEKNNE